MTGPEPLHFDAAVFDLDGVLTGTTRLHVAAWGEMIDDYLARRAERFGEEQPPFDPDEEYRRYVDGKPRYQGLASFLEARGIELPWGEPSDPPGRETVCWLGNRKQEIFRARLEDEGVERMEAMLDLARALRERGAAVGLATSSRNGRRVVEAAGIGGHADAVVDGVALDDLGLTGKPEPDLFLETVRRLGAEAGRSVLFEDSRGGRGGAPGRLRAHRGRGRRRAAPRPASPTAADYLLQDPDEVRELLERLAG